MENNILEQYINLDKEIRGLQQNKYLLAKKYYEEKYPQFLEGNIVFYTSSGEFRFYLIEMVEISLATYREKDGENLIERHFYFFSNGTEILKSGVSKKKHYNSIFSGCTFLCKYSEFEYLSKKYKMNTRLNQSNLLRLFVELQKEKPETENPKL